VVEPAGEDSDGEQGPLEGDDLHDRPEVGDTVEVHEKEWIKAATMGQDARGNKPRQGFQFRRLVVNSTTARSDMWKELLPCSIPDLVDLVRARAVQKNDKGVFTTDGCIKFLACLYAGAQFQAGTDVWAKEMKGLMPPPNFGRFMSRDKFIRWMRYISMGKPQDDDSNDPWHEVRWLVDGQNKNRRKTCRASWLVVVDEAMWQWTGQGMPHLSFVQRKPELSRWGAKSRTCAVGNRG